MKNLIRHSLSSFMAGAGTFVLIIVMMQLIELDKVSVAGTKPPPRFDLLRVKEETPVRVEKDKRPEPPRPNEMPELEPDARPDFGPTEGISVNAPDAPTDDTMDMGKVDIGGPPTDGDSVPVVRVEPVYPPIAAQRGIEGWVVIGFTVSANGTVKNVKILDSQPARIFDDAAIKAVRRWKYNPRIVDGRPVATPNQKTRLTFKLD